MHIRQEMPRHTGESLVEHRRRWKRFLPGTVRVKSVEQQKHAR